jgi:hypothetical protein
VVSSVSYVFYISSVDVSMSCQVSVSGSVLYLLVSLIIRRVFSVRLILLVMLLRVMACAQPLGLISASHLVFIFVCVWLFLSLMANLESSVLMLPPQKTYLHCLCSWAKPSIASEKLILGMNYIDCSRYVCFESFIQRLC